MYKYTLYLLGFLLIASIALGAFGLLFFDPLNIFLQTLFLLILCKILNLVFSKVVGAIINIESDLITALILSLIVGPFSLSLKNYLFLTAVAFIAMASKYLLALKKRHIFNPAAVSVVLTAIILNQGASWWIGNLPMLPFVAIVGFLIIKKIRRFTLVLSFLLFYITASFLLGSDPVVLILYTPIIFFTTVMLIEPLTSPRSTKKQVAYSAIVAGAFILYQKILATGYTLELALITGNVFSYFSANQLRVTLKFKEKKKLAKETFAFYFKPEKEVNYKPGQFMHWTLPHENPDSRGIRRYFTIASAPHEENIKIAVKIPEKSSSFKSRLLNMKKGAKIEGMDVSGEFTLPNDKEKPLAFIAGGIGITPFVSMMSHLIENKEKRDIVLLYANQTKEYEDFKELIEKAKEYGVKTHYSITKEDGFVDGKMIKKVIPDYKDRLIYISGPKPMVSSLRNALYKLGSRNVKTDFFPGYDEKF